MGYLTKPPPGTPIDWGKDRSQGLVAQWLFNENGGGKVYDLVTGRSAQLTNMGPEAWQPAKFGSGLQFNGSNGYASAPAGMTGDPMSIIFWMNQPADTATRIFFMDRDAWNGNTGLEIWSAWYATLSVRGSSSTGVESNRTTGVFEGVGWVQAGFVFDGTTVYIYKNGIFVNSGTIAAVALSAHNFLMGIYGDESSYPMDGMLDNVCLFNRALPAGEMMDSFKDPFGMMWESRIKYHFVAAAPPVGVAMPVLSSQGIHSAVFGGQVLTG